MHDWIELFCKGFFFVFFFSLGKHDVIGWIFFFFLDSNWKLRL